MLLLREIWARKGQLFNQESIRDVTLPTFAFSKACLKATWKRFLSKQFVSVCAYIYKTKYQWLGICNETSRQCLFPLLWLTFYVMWMAIHWVCHYTACVYTVYTVCVVCVCLSVVCMNAIERTKLLHAARPFFVSPPMRDQCSKLSQRNLLLLTLLTDVHST